MSEASPARTRRTPSRRAPKRPPDAPGLAPRRAALEALLALRKRKGFDETLDRGAPLMAALEPRDRAQARALARTVLRRRGQIDHVLKACLTKGLPRGAKGGVGRRIEAILQMGAAQLLFLDVADHAAVDLSVRLALADDAARHFRPLVNGVLRRIGREGGALLEGASVIDNVPPWLARRWERAWGRNALEAMAEVLSREPALDVTPKGEVGDWPERLGARALPTGSLRCENAGAVTALPGFQEGAWWVQDAAAAVPVRLLGPVAGLRVADLCAAPGGKTAQLAAAGAEVVALDRSSERLGLLEQNLARLGLTARIVTADAGGWVPDAALDAILLDAPCSATGTLRRHPDVGAMKREADIIALRPVQDRLLAHAASLLKPGGTLVYCTCSLEKEEGEHRVDALLKANRGLARVPVTPDEVGGVEGWIDARGDLRILPHVLRGPTPELSGSDGFFAARLRRL